MSKLAERVGPLAQFRRPADIALVARVVGLGTAVPLLMRLPLPRLAGVLSAVSRRTPTTPGPSRDVGPSEDAGPSEDEVRTMVASVEAVQRAGRPLIRSGCLTRGVTLYVLLRRAGAPVELCFGVGRVGEDLAGHCWLVRHGQPYLEPAGSPARFDVVYRIPAPQA